MLASAILLAVTGTVSAGASEPADRRGDAAAVQASHDVLRDAAEAGDVEKVKSALDELGSLLTELATGQRNANRDLVDSASEATAAAREQLARQFPAESARADVPPLPQILSQFLQQVFQILILLVESLLGGGVPVPVQPA